MAKSKLTEKVTQTHTLSCEGILDLENHTIEIEDFGAVALAELMSNFDGQVVKLSIQTKTEKDVIDA